MRNYIYRLSLLSLIFFNGCNKSADNNRDKMGSMTEDTNLTIDSLPSIEFSTQDCDSMLNPDSITIAHTPSEKELKELQTLILDRLQHLKGNPLQANIYAVGLLPDAVEVYLEINSIYWQKEFRKYITNSQYVKFRGDSKPTPISEIVDSIINPSNISLLPDNPSFSANSKYASFTLTNDSENNISFGENYIVGYRGEDGKWYRLPHTGMWNDIGIELKPTGKYTFEAALTPLLNNNQPGVYRLYKYIRFEGDKRKKWLMTEFVLE